MDIFEMRRNVNESQINRLVDEFYRSVRADELLGPVFSSRISDEDWAGHVERVSDFWSTALIGTGTYRRNPLGPHLHLGLESVHFERWLTLFEKTLGGIFPCEVAQSILSRAKRMSGHMERECQKFPGVAAP